MLKNKNDTRTNTYFFSSGQDLISGRKTMSLIYLDELISAVSVLFKLFFKIALLRDHLFFHTIYDRAGAMTQACSFVNVFQLRSKT